MGKPEKAVLIGLITYHQPEEQAKEYLNELAFLAETAGAKTVKKFTQKVSDPHPKTFVGSGKLKEIAEYIKEHEIDMAIFDDELSPAQIRNIERLINGEDTEAEKLCKILDRANLILDIFANRAKTAQAKTQVELAQNEYLLPRLTRLWTHLSKQKGGIGMKGPGEKEIETDRRIIRDRIILLKEKLAQIDKQFITQRKNRKAQIRVALVGYTNVGKSTLMNLLSKSKVFAEDKLFATLDATTRKVVLENVPFLLSDTVGFIRKLPHSLVESFKSTLDEVREADLLLHVVDLSHPNFEEQINVVNETLKELNASDKNVLMVFNKIDLIKSTPEDLPDYAIETENPIPDLESLKKTWIAKENKSIFISAVKKQNIEELRTEVSKKVKQLWHERYPYMHKHF